MKIQILILLIATLCLLNCGATADNELKDRLSNLKNINLKNTNLRSSCTVCALFCLPCVVNCCDVGSFCPQCR